jgi:hypothetical protein
LGGQQVELASLPQMTLITQTQYVSLQKLVPGVFMGA